THPAHRNRRRNRAVLGDRPGRGRDHRRDGQTDQDGGNRRRQPEAPIGVHLAEPLCEAAPESRSYSSSSEPGSSAPSRSSRSAHSSRGSNDHTASSMPACRSPSSANRAGMVYMVKSPGSAESISDHSMGAETVASGKPRTE